MVQFIGIMTHGFQLVIISDELKRVIKLLFWMNSDGQLILKQS
jgi:hypothetical protein